MNCNPDGTRLTKDDLCRIATDAGFGAKVSAIVSASKGTNMTMSDLIDLTRNVRFTLFMKGHLTMDSGPVD